jgi:hypothetical protein
MADEKVTQEDMETFHKLVQESWKKNPSSPLFEKGVPGTDSSFKTPVISPEDYLELTKKLREQYGKKLRPWERKPSENPFKGPVKKLEEESEMKKWDKFIEETDKIEDPEKRNFEEYKWNFEKWYLDTLKKQGSKVRQV